MNCTCKLIYNGFADGLVGSGDYADKSILLTVGKVLAYAVIQGLISFGDWEVYQLPVGAIRRKRRLGFNICHD